MSALKVDGLKPGKFTLRLYFAEFEEARAGERVFDVMGEGKQLIESLDIAAEAGGSMRCIVKEFPGLSIDGSLDVAFKASKGRTLVCGLELIAQHLEPGKVFVFERKEAGHRLVLPARR